MFVFLVPNISQVMMKYEMEPPSYTTRQISFVWHNGRRATTQLGRFTLSHNSRQDKQRGFIDACIRSRTHFPKTVTTHAKKIVDLQQTLEICTLYEDKQLRRGHTNYHVSQRVKVRQSVSNRLKARRMCVDTNAISKKPPLLGVIGAQDSVFDMFVRRAGTS